MQDKLKLLVSICICYTIDKRRKKLCSSKKYVFFKSFRTIIILE